MSTHPYRTGPGTFTVSRCKHADITHFASQAYSEASVNLRRDTNGTEWYRAVDDATGTTIACAGVIYPRDGSARMKGLFVLPAFRNRGVADTINDIRVAEPIRRGCRVIEAFTRPKPRWERRGFKAVGFRPNGRTMIYRLIVAD